MYRTHFFNKEKLITGEQALVVVLDEIHAAQTDCFADDYIRNFNKAQREGSFLYHLLKTPHNHVHVKWEIF